VKRDVRPASGRPTILVSDSSKAREVSGWAPKFAAFDQQIMHAWTWFRDRRHLTCGPVL
jgi:UDP-glucose 4-epimerase